MSDEAIVPTSIDELRSIIAGESSLLAVGNRTKRPLSRCDAKLISLRSISGIVEYEPSEFTFTARAGTPVAEIAAALGEKNQYLPFDPMLIGAGATIGGTVAAGMSGPGRFRFGGLRDFLLGVDFISGEGKMIRAGGKVVKNAAGFDLPKFMIGSMGRLGVITEMTFKVFPKQTESQTIRVSCESHAQAVQRMMTAGSSTWELDAIDYRVSEKTIYIRVAGPGEVNQAIADKIASQWGADVSVTDSGQEFWRSVVELNWADDASIAVKVPIAPGQVVQFCDSCVTSSHLSAAGNVAWITLANEGELPELNRRLETQELSGLVVRGNTLTAFVGNWPRTELASSLKNAMDPDGRFPELVG